MIIERDIHISANNMLYIDYIVVGEFLIFCDHLSDFQKNNFAALNSRNLAEMHLSKKP